MKIVRYVVLEGLLLIAMLLCGTAVMKIMDILLQLSYENIWSIGFKVGFLAWLVLLVNILYRIVKKSKNLSQIRGNDSEF